MVGRGLIKIFALLASPPQLTKNWNFKNPQLGKSTIIFMKLSFNHNFENFKYSNQSKQNLVSDVLGINSVNEIESQYSDLGL